MVVKLGQKSFQGAILGITGCLRKMKYTKPKEEMKYLTVPSRKLEQEETTPDF